MEHKHAWCISDEWTNMRGGKKGDWKNRNDWEDKVKTEIQSSENKRTGETRPQEAAIFCEEFLCPLGDGGRSDDGGEGIFDVDEPETQESQTEACNCWLHIFSALVFRSSSVSRMHVHRPSSASFFAQYLFHSQLLLCCLCLTCIQRLLRICIHLQDSTNDLNMAEEPVCSVGPCRRTDGLESC